MRKHLGTTDLTHTHTHHREYRYMNGDVTVVTDYHKIQHSKILASTAMLRLKNSCCHGFTQGLLDFPLVRQGVWLLLCLTTCHRIEIFQFG